MFVDELDKIEYRSRFALRQKVDLYEDNYDEESSADSVCKDHRPDDQWASK